MCVPAFLVVYNDVLKKAHNHVYHIAIIKLRIKLRTFT